MAGPATVRATYAEYLALEASSEVRHEYVAGVVVAMAGGSIEHGRIIAQLQYLLRVALAGRTCLVLTSDVRVRIRAADRTTYPDAVVVCDEIKRDPDDHSAIVNPTVIVEGYRTAPRRSIARRRAPTTAGCHRCASTCWSRSASGASRSIAGAGLGAGRSTS